MASRSFCRFGVFTCPPHNKSVPDVNSSHFGFFSYHSIHFTEVIPVSFSIFAQESAVGRLLPSSQFATAVCDTSSCLAITDRFHPSGPCWSRQRRSGFCSRHAAKASFALIRRFAIPASQS